MNQNKKIAIGLLFGVVGAVSFFSAESKYLNLDVFAKEAQSRNSKLQQQTGPLITYESEQVGDREKLKVTVKVEDRSGIGIKEFRDHTDKLINGNSYTFEITRRGNYIFTAVDNNNQKSSIKIDDFWVNPYTKGIQARLDYGSSYWSSSNMREWLNSDLVTPNYTGISYIDRDKGFLNEFTESEKDAIAITERRVLISSDMDFIAKEGGEGGAGHLNVYDTSAYLANYYDLLNYKKYGYKKDLDKVFLLTPYEEYWYIERRGEFHKKILSSQARKKHKNVTNLYQYWWMQGGTIHSNRDANYIVRNRDDTHGFSWECSKKYGVVPALNIKPEYIFNDGKAARDLNIGDEVIFGNYLGAEIKWVVINISDSGFPLLLSKEVLDMKEFDMPGDQSRLYSDYINFKQYDVSLFKDIQYKSTKNTDDVDFPTLTILNKEELDRRKNNSFEIELEISDYESGLAYIELPNGSKLKYSSEDIVHTEGVNYTFSENGNYVFRLMDNSGNYNEYLININNINQSPKVSVIQSNSNWSSEGVRIDIDSSVNVKYTKDLIRLGVGKEFGGDMFPNYASYVSKKFKISGYAEVESYKNYILDKNLRVGLGFYYNTKEYKEETVKLSAYWGPTKTININDIIASGKQYFEFEIEIPQNYAYNLKPRVTVTSFYNAKSDDIKVKITDLKYECLDTNEFEILSIELPDGSLINDSSYSYKMETEGVHELTYKILDNRGVTTEKTITVKIDKTAPELNLTYDKDELVNNRGATVNVNTSDNLSGVKRVKLPNGNYTTSLNASYVVSGNGNYVFECEDVAGNITNKTISVNGNSSNLNTEVNKSNNWTNKGVQINIDLNK